MKTSLLIYSAFILLILTITCEKNNIEISTNLQDVDKTKYYDFEIFEGSNLKIYGTWELFAISGGFTGLGHDPDFDYLEIKEYGIYGFIRNDSLLEYGKIELAAQAMNEIHTKVSFEKDENSDSFFEDRVKYIVFTENDTLNLNSPCCDRYNYHFVRKN